MGKFGRRASFPALGMAFLSIAMMALVIAGAASAEAKSTLQGSVQSNGDGL